MKLLFTRLLASTLMLFPSAFRRMTCQGTDEYGNPIQSNPIPCSYRSSKRQLVWQAPLRALRINSQHSCGLRQPSRNRHLTLLLFTPTSSRSVSDRCWSAIDSLLHAQLVVEIRAARHRPSLPVPPTRPHPRPIQMYLVGQLSSAFAGSASNHMDTTEPAP